MNQDKTKSVIHIIPLALILLVIFAVFNVIGSCAANSQTLPEHKEYLNQ